MKNLVVTFLKVVCVLTLAFNVCYGAVYRTGVAEGSVTYSGGGSSSGGPTNGMTGTEVTNTVNGLVPPMLATTSNALYSGDQTVNATAENWLRYLNRGSNATILSFGDSTGLYSVSYLRPQLEHYLGSNGVVAGSFSPIMLGGAYTNLGSASSTNWAGTFYILGTNSVDGPGAIYTTNYGTANNGAIWSDTFRVYVGKSPSAGTLMWQTQTNGGAWVNQAIINANGTYGIVATQMVVSPIGWYRSRLIYSNSGPTMVFGIEQFDGTATGRGVRFLDLTVAGSAIGQITNISTNVLGPALQLFNPAMITMEHRDSSNEYVNALPFVRSLLTNWVPDADVVLIGVGPQLNDDYHLVGQNAVARSFALSNGWSYIDMRAMPAFSSFYSVTNFYGTNDGGAYHYPTDATKAQADWMLKHLPLLNNAFINGVWVGGAPSMSPPQGGRYFDPRKATNNLSGNLGIDGFATVGNYLEVSGSFLYGGASSGLVLANRSSPTDAGSRWTLYNSGGTLIHYYGGDIFEQNVSAGNYRFSPSSSGSAASRLGDTNKAWSQLHASNVIAYAKVGINTNAPTAALEVQGSANLSGSVLASGITNRGALQITNGGNDLVISAGAGAISFFGNWSYINQANNGGWALSSSASAAQYTFKNDTSTGFGTSGNATKDLTFTINGIRRAHLTTNGSSAVFSVDGTVIATNGYTISVNTPADLATITNGLARMWNSNGAIYMRTSRVAGTNWIDNFMFAAP